MMSSERPQSERGNTRLNQRRWLSASAPAGAGAAGKSGSRLCAGSIGLEDITRSTHGLETAREFRIALDLAAEPRHLHIDSAEIAAALRLERQRLARHRLARLARQRDEQSRLRLGQMHGLAAAIERVALQIEAQRALSRRRARERAR